MIKERVKSFILVILVVFTLVLAERILVDEKLWPTGYNFFSIGINQRKNDGLVSDSLTAPERIIVNTGYQSSRFQYLFPSREYKEILTAANGILKSAFNKPERDISQISPEVWYTGLTGKSIYLAYPTTFSAQVFSRLSGYGDTEAQFKSFSDIVIDEDGTVFVNDNGAFYKIETTSSEIAGIIESVLKTNEAEQSVINYSFDLNFDKADGSEKTILAPMIPIYSEAVQAEVVEAKNPLDKDGEINQKVVNEILTAFAVNPNSTWRYTEADGTLVFVENTGVLKISSDGVLTFTASDAGIQISSASARTYETVADVAAFIDTVNLAIDEDIRMFVTSSLSEDNASQFTFDYTVGGIPVKYNSKSAVSVTVNGGYITEYSHILRQYKPLGYSEFSPVYIEALDRIIAKYQSSMNQINIKKMFPAYIDNLESGNKTPDWHIEIDNVIIE